MINLKATIEHIENITENNSKELNDIRDVLRDDYNAHIIITHHYDGQGNVKMYSWSIENNKDVIRGNPRSTYYKALYSAVRSFIKMEK